MNDHLTWPDVVVLLGHVDLRLRPRVDFDARAPEK